MTDCLYSLLNQFFELSMQLLNDSLIVNYMDDDESVKNKVSYK